MEKLRRRTKKILIGIVGGLVVVIGLILVPYPGPGWLVVFTGLAILSTEFIFASKILEYAKGKYEQWLEWLKNQNVYMRTVVLAITSLVVLVTLWLLNVFGFVNNFLNLPFDWVISPFMR